MALFMAIDIRENIDQFLAKADSLPTSFFIYWLESIIDEQIKDVSIWLKEEELTKIEPDFIEEISKTIKQIETKQSRLSRFFYNIFGIEQDKELSKKKLKAEIETLHIEINRLNKDIKQNYKNQQKIDNTLEYLRELKKNILNKIFIKEIENKIELLEGYALSLSLKKNNLLEMKEIYKRLFEYK